MANDSGWRYATVSINFWNDLKVRAWSDDGRLAALYLLTNPHTTGNGFYHLPLATAADDLGWDRERFDRALSELRADDFADYDSVARLVFVVKGLKYAPAIKGPPQIKGALNALDKAKGSPHLFGRFLAAADDYQFDLAAAIRDCYKLKQGPYETA